MRPSLIRRGGVARLMAPALLAASLACAAELAAPAGDLPAAVAHGGHAHGLSERRLRAAETAVLGEAHAVDHSRQRRAMRDPAVRRRLRREQAQSRVRARAAVAGPADQVGRWGAAFPSPVLGVNSVLLPTGKVLIFAYTVAYSSRDSQAYVWDPTKTGQSAYKRVTPPIDPDTGVPVNLWCAGNSLLPDGRVVVAGGNLRYAGEGNYYAGLRRVYTFNPWNETWTEQPPMRKGRWYPSQLLLPDGRTMIMSGLDESGSLEQRINRDIEIFTPSADLDGVGTIAPHGPLEWINSAGGPPLSNATYPHLFWMPSGRALVAGPGQEDSWFLERPGTDGSARWTDAPDPKRKRGYGSAVLLPGGPSGSTRVMALGGTWGDGPATDTTEIFDEANSSAGWNYATSQHVGRQSANTVLLPDGGAVTVGGGTRTSELYEATPDHRQVELLDPQTGEWRLGAAQAENRTYHSTAVLLPDGRVMSTGDDSFGGNSSDTVELYEPPYLHKGARPRITAAPAAVRHGESFTVNSADDVRRAVLMAPGSTTHANDMNQRHVELEVVARTPGQGLTLRAPAHADLAVPGHYMLFLLNDRGVPSEARWVRLGADAAKVDPPASPPPAAPQPPPAPPAQPATPREVPKGAADDPTRPSRGLSAVLFDNANLSAARVRRVDGTVAFDWGRRAPARGMGADTFSARWSGAIVPERTGWYRLSVGADDGARLWIDGRAVVRGWGNSGFAERTARVRLRAGRRHALRLEFRERRGQAKVGLRWSGPGVRRQVVPARVLRPR